MTIKYGIRDNHRFRLQVLSADWRQCYAEIKFSMGVKLYSGSMNGDQHTTVHNGGYGISREELLKLLERNLSLPLTRLAETSFWINNLYYSITAL